MDMQKLLYENLKDIKDYWVKTSVEGITRNTDLIWSEVELQYKILRDKIASDEEKIAYEKIINEVIKGVIHSVLVMIDGGDKLADHYLIDLIEQKTRKSIKENGALHEAFYEYLLDVEE